MAQISEKILYVDPAFTTVEGDCEFKTLQEAIDVVPVSEAYTIILHSSLTDIPELVLRNNAISIKIDGRCRNGITFAEGADIVSMGINKKISFNNMISVRGGQILLGESGTAIEFNNCDNVVTSIRSEQYSTTSTKIYGTNFYGMTGRAGVEVRGANASISVEGSLVKGATGYPAFDLFISSDRMIKMKKSVILHGSGGDNCPINTNGGISVGMHVYNCSSNKGLFCNNIINYIVANNNVVDPEIIF